MRKSNFSQEKIIYALTLVDQGTTISEICREMGISHNTFYQWKKKYAGMGVNEAKKLKELKNGRTLSFNIPSEVIGILVLYNFAKMQLLKLCNTEPFELLLEKPNPHFYTSYKRI